MRNEVKVAIKVKKLAIFRMLNIKLLLKKTLIKRTKTLRNGPMNN